MKTVFLVQHVHIIDKKEDTEDVKIIGVFTTRENAEQAISNLKNVIGFKESPDVFYIDRYVLDKTCWEEGYITS